MARHARILAKITDVLGDEWDVREARMTRWQWFLYLGWPHGFKRGKGEIGGPRVVITDELLTYLHTHRERGDVDRMASELPIGRTTIKRLRQVLGHNVYSDTADWWHERADDLADMTLEAFAAKHNRSIGIASMMSTEMYGPRIREAGWWKKEPAAKLLRGTLPRAYVADRLGISIGAVGRLRWVLRSQAR